MNHKNLFETFSNRGKLLLSDQNILFQDIPWSKHPEFEGVELKHILTATQTGGQFSYHLVRIAPNKKIGNHIHTEQTETHEVIAGAGFCMNNQIKLPDEMALVVKPCAQSHFCRVFLPLQQTLCFTDTFLYLELMRG